MNHAKTIANIIINDLMKHANKKKCKITDFGLSPSDLAWLGALTLSSAFLGGLDNSTFDSLLP